MHTVAIIQARMQSTRLPRKVLADLEGRPMLYRVIERAHRATRLNQLLVATSDRPADDPIAHFCDDYHVDCFRGDADDVLDRYVRAARHAQAELIVRLTADCPLLDPAVVDRVIGAFHPDRYDYASNTLECTYPDGLDTEVFTRRALERAAAAANRASQREHVTPYITTHPEHFRLLNVRHTQDLSHLRWTVDEPADLEFARAVYAQCGPEPFGMHEVLRTLAAQPQLTQLNQGIRRNEGYEHSLRTDHLARTSHQR